MPADEESAKALTKNPLGHSGKAVAANVKRLLQEQNLTFAALSSRLENLGRPIPPLGLRKIVAETRRVDSDDLVGLALALGTTPATLLMPRIREAKPDDLIEVTGASFPVEARRVWEWLTARNRISRMTFSTFIDRSWPTWERESYESDRYEKWEQSHDELMGQLWPTGESSNGDD